MVKTLTEDLGLREAGNYYRSPDGRIMRLLNILNDEGNLPYDLQVQWYSSSGRKKETGRFFAGQLPFIKTYRFTRLSPEERRRFIGHRSSSNRLMAA